MNKQSESQEQKHSPDITKIYVDAFRCMQGYLYILDRNCVLIDCNTNFLNLLGLDSISEKSIGSLYKMMVKHGPWSEEQIQIIKQNDINVILTAQPQINTLDLPIIDSNGEVIYFQSSRIPLLDDTGVVHGLMVSLTNITEYKQMTEQLEKIKQQLQTQNAQQNTSVIDNFANKRGSASPKILIVEDNAIAQKAAQSILMNNDCLVEIADSEAKFNDVFEPGKYDLVFMDIGLENTSGYIMAKQLRLKEQNSGYHVPIIALTGYEADVVRFDCDYYQMEGVITKPLTAEQVKQIIQHYIFNIELEVTGLKSVSHRKAAS